MLWPFRLRHYCLVGKYRYIRRTHYCIFRARRRQYVPLEPSTRLHGVMTLKTSIWICNNKFVLTINGHIDHWLIWIHKEGAWKLLSNWNTAFQTALKIFHIKVARNKIIFEHVYLQVMLQIFYSECSHFESQLRHWLSWLSSCMVFLGPPGKCRDGTSGGSWVLPFDFFQFISHLTLYSLITEVINWKEKTNWHLLRMSWPKHSVRLAEMSIYVYDNTLCTF